MEKFNIEIFKTLFSHRKPIIIVTFLSLIVAYVVCMPFFIKPVYKSTAYVYPANIGLYSEESLTEQLLQFAQSNEVRQYLFKKYNLAQHYKIDTTKKIYPFFYDEIYDKKISVSMTKYESVEIRVEDYSPDTATLLANGVIEAVNSIIEKEHRQKYLEVVRNAKTYLDLKQAELDSTQNVLNELSEKYGVVDMPIQLKEAARSYYSKDANGAKLTDLMASLGKHGVEFVKMSTYLEEQMKDYVEAVTDYKKSVNALKSKKTFTAMASKPTYPVVACWPKRSMIMIVTGISIFVLACIYFVFIEKLKAAYRQVSSNIKAPDTSR